MWVNRIYKRRQGHKGDPFAQKSSSSLQAWTTFILVCITNGASGDTCAIMSRQLESFIVQVCNLDYLSLFLINASLVCIKKSGVSKEDPTIKGNHQNTLAAFFTIAKLQPE